METATMTTTSTPEAIWNEAAAAAAVAAKAENTRLPPEQKRGFDCGYSWVVIKPARGPFVQFCKAGNRGYKRTWGGGGYEILAGTDMHGEVTQSISVHQAATRAFVEVLKRHGIECYTGSRLD